MSETLFPISVETLWLFLLTCLVIEITPGPNMGFLTIVSASRGRRYGFAVVAGIALGLLLVGVIAAAGLASVISKSPPLYQGLRFAGVAYLLWLAYDEWRDADDIAGPDEHQESLLSFFRHGLIVNLLNPKAAVFFITILPTFILQKNKVMPQAMMLTVIYVVIATVVHMAIVTAAGALQPMLHNPKVKRRVRRILAVLLALIAIWFAVESR